MSSSQLTALDKERQSRRAKLTVALREDEDPLAVYDDFIKWTISSYPSEFIPRSGLLELLEEAGREFKSDKTYQGDRRYLKLWLTYAQYVDNDVEGPAAEIYKHLIRNNIGTAYAQLYEDYATSLERFDRRQDADKVYRHGIQKRARPVERLKQHYAEFQARSDRTQRGPSPCPVPSSAWKDAPKEVQLLRRYPLKNWPRTGKATATPGASSSSTSATPAIQEAVASSIQKHGHGRYAPMLTPSSGAHKKPEQLRFNLSLLFTEDGMEYCREEVRARSMGLLGKKWPPPPPPTSSNASSSDRVGRQGGNTTKKMYAEPTVTIATKEALADVFGMYNSPERTLRFGPAAGSKHAPVHKIEPMVQLKPVKSNKSENDQASSKKPASFQPLSDENNNSLGKSGFRPFVDENEDHGAKNTSHSLAEFRIFQDEQNPPPKENPPTTSRERLALSKKDSGVAFTRMSSPDVNDEDRKKTSHQKEKEPNIFMPIFTPVASTINRPSTLAQKSSPAPATTPAPQFKFKPFVDSDADPEDTKPPAPIPNIFTRTPKTENPPPIARALAPKPSFAPFVDNEQPVLGEHSRSTTPLQAQSTPSTSTDEDGYQEYMGEMMAQAQQQDYYDDYESTDESGYEEASPSMPPVYANIDDEEDFEDDDEMDDYQAPMGGRLGNFNVMTPITERTYEFTHTTAGALSARGTPSDGSRAYTNDLINAKQSAEQLAAELAEDDGDDFSDVGDENIGQVEEKTGTLSLSDALAAVSSFKPPNPCNPFDPSIVSSLLSFVPPDTSFQDLRNQESNQLEGLQRFSKQKKRRASGNSSRDSLQGKLAVVLDGRQYDVLDKLGEGGFGAVFEAIDVVSANEKHGIEDEDDFDLIDEDEIPKIALKVVKPRNLWEFHVLRRIHQALPARIKQSVIVPEALYAYRDESFLILELLKQGTLLDVVNKAASAGITQQGACLDELLVVFFTIELLRLVEGIHRAGFIHGDLKIDNCLLRLEEVPGGASAWTSVYQPSGEGGWGYKGIKMIDFGRTIDTRMFPHGQRFVGDWDPDERDCVELREGRPWTYQTDYFGLAGIIYSMLYGKYIETSSITPVPNTEGPTRYKLATLFKRYWQGDLWTRLFDVLLNSALIRPDGKLPLCDEISVLREEMETWLQANCNRASNSLKGLLKKVDLITLGGKDGR
ncbi:Mad3/BUB1 homology region 1-domain-containing protein [Irpex rosettiformis]|uniref:Mad3/BUB1 homology region 1-domain-containing protein n=1 Tax=Irpex rosettiformis TaxID=378272 RepID=A0ACB8UAI3_9APHY|nr:Mad3/BUB1 homology region 1-domain-containing protein [Irpex rosettiformis]